MRPRDVDTARRPFVLVWEVTRACDLACDHCRAEAEPHRHPGELTTAEGKRLLDEARRFGEDQLVVLSGGDPLYRDDTLDLIEYGVDRGLEMTLTPSGTASLTDRRVGRLAGTGLRRLALSIDGGSAATHDEFRGEAGSFEQTVAAARAARRADLPLQINTTVCAETVDDLPAIRDLVADLDAVLWSVFFLVPVGRGRVLDPVSPERAEGVMAWLADVAADAPFGVKTTEAPHYRRVRLQRRERATGDGPATGSGPGRPDDGPAGRPDDGPAGRPDDGPAGRPDDGPAGRPDDGPAGRPDDGPAGRPEDEFDGRRDAIGRRTGIGAGDGFAFVSHTGEVFPSGFLPDSAGNVREESIVDVYRQSRLFEVLRTPDALEGKCGACEYRHVCGGSRSRAYAYTGDPLASDPLCAYVPDGYDGPLPGQSLSG